MGTPDIFDGVRTKRRLIEEEKNEKEQRRLKKNSNASSRLSNTGRKQSGFSMLKSIDPGRNMNSLINTSKKKPVKKKKSGFSRHVSLSLSSDDDTFERDQTNNDELKNVMKNALLPKL